MKYQYTYRNTPADYWRFYMGNVYRSWTACINVLFTAAFLILSVRRWAAAPLWGKGILVMAVLLFPVFQPLAIWGRAARTAEEIREDTTLGFSDAGMEIRVRDHVQRIPWKKFTGKGAVKLRGLQAVSLDGSHLYLLPDRVTGKEKEALACFILEHCAA